MSGLFRSRVGSLLSRLFSGLPAGYRLPAGMGVGLLMLAIGLRTYGPHPAGGPPGAEYTSALARRPAMPRYESRPIPADPRAHTQAEDRALEAAWYDRNMVKTYAAVGRHDPRWDRKAAEFLEGSGAWFAHVSGASGRERLLEQGEALLKLGCADPLVLYACARLRIAGGAWDRETTVLLERASDGMKSVLYPRGMARLAVSGLLEAYIRIGELEKCEQLSRVELRYFDDSLIDGSFRAVDNPVLAGQLTPGDGASFFSRRGPAIVKVLYEAPVVKPWVRQLFLGKMELELAWEARGPSFPPDRVTDGQWRSFYQHIALARQALEASWTLNPSRPEAAALMIGLVRSSPMAPGESARLWFDRSVAAQLDYPPAYDEMVSSLEPRRAGSREAEKRFGRANIAPAGEGDCRMGAARGNPTARAGRRLAGADRPE